MTAFITEEEALKLFTALDSKLRDLEKKHGELLAEISLTEELRGRYAMLWSSLEKERKQKEAKRE